MFCSNWFKANLTECEKLSEALDEQLESEVQLKLNGSHAAGAADSDEDVHPRISLDVSEDLNAGQNAGRLGSYDESIEHVMKMIDDETEIGRVPHDKVLLVGTGQSASVALGAALRSRKRIGGLVLLSGYMSESLSIEEQHVCLGLRTYISQGRGDLVVSPYSCVQLGHALQDLGLQVVEVVRR